MNPLAISLACQNSDRTRPLLDGRVRIEGVSFTFVPADPEEIFHRTFRNQEFDVCEISLATHLALTSREGSPLTGVPVFLSRAFRHSAIYIRRDRGIETPADLKGRRIGVPDYQQTAGLWVRGMMLDEYGVQPADVHWLVGGQERRILRVDDAREGREEVDGGHGAHQPQGHHDPAEPDREAAEAFEEALHRRPRSVPRPAGVVGSRSSGSP